MIGGLRAGMGYTGSKNIQDLYKARIYKDNYILVT